MLSTDPEVESSAGSVDDLHGESGTPLPSSPRRPHGGHFDFHDDSHFATCAECLSINSRVQGN